MQNFADVVSFRYANEADLSTLISLLYDDDLGSARESTDPKMFSDYSAAFRRIQASQDNNIILAETGDEIVGMLQLTLLPGLTHRGSLRGQIEGVRVKKGFRAKGIGRKLFRFAIEAAGRAGCQIIQLTTDRQRPDAIAFYTSLGFIDSHLGMKLMLERPEPTGGKPQ
ncbi:GNAT family N-acetyltransferase [Leclercia adecarboxylata]|uniref:GNAT family N-acetyltransferase n=1 Tax=Leclercia adecarboxylata TaxID=83655 RepID=UPI002DC00E4A|nr:GNAT family N-acetyltransferase [Leclercia adecarboxylata]MEB6381545.1 GNAT family N-acetyltransferase [Leclercia adecarboxylata]